MADKSTCKHQTISESMALALIDLYRKVGTRRVGKDISRLSGSQEIFVRLQRRGFVELRYVLGLDRGFAKLTKSGIAFAKGKLKVKKYHLFREWGPSVTIQDCLSGRYDYDRLMGHAD